MSETKTVEKYNSQSEPPFRWNDDWVVENEEEREEDNSDDGASDFDFDFHNHVEEEKEEIPHDNVEEKEEEIPQWHTNTTLWIRHLIEKFDQQLEVEIYPPKEWESQTRKEKLATLIRFFRASLGLPFLSDLQIEQLIVQSLNSTSRNRNEKYSNLNVLYELTELKEVKQEPILYILPGSLRCLETSHIVSVKGFVTPHRKLRTEIENQKKQKITKRTRKFLKDDQEKKQTKKRKRKTLKDEQQLARRKPWWIRMRFQFDYVFFCPCSHECQHQQLRPKLEFCPARRFVGLCTTLIQNYGHTTIRNGIEKYQLVLAGSYSKLPLEIKSLQTERKENKQEELFGEITHFIFCDPFLDAPWGAKAKPLYSAWEINDFKKGRFCTMNVDEAYEWIQVKEMSKILRVQEPSEEAQINFTFRTKWIDVQNGCELEKFSLDSRISEPLFRSIRERQNSNKWIQTAKISIFLWNLASYWTNLIKVPPQSPLLVSPPSLGLKAENLQTTRTTTLKKTSKIKLKKKQEAKKQEQSEEFKSQTLRDWIEVTTIPSERGKDDINTNKEEIDEKSDRFLNDQHIPPCWWVWHQTMQLFWDSWSVFRFKASSAEMFFSEFHKRIPFLARSVVSKIYSRFSFCKEENKAKKETPLTWSQSPKLYFYAPRLWCTEEESKNAPSPTLFYITWSTKRTTDDQSICIFDHWIVTRGKNYQKEKISAEDLVFQETEAKFYTKKWKLVHSTMALLMQLSPTENHIRGKSETYFFSDPRDLLESSEPRVSYQMDSFWSSSLPTKIPLQVPVETKAEYNTLETKTQSQGQPPLYERKQKEKEKIRKFRSLSNSFNQTFAQSEFYCSSWFCVLSGLRYGFGPENKRFCPLTRVTWTSNITLNSYNAKCKSISIHDWSFLNRRKKTLLSMVPKTFIGNPVPFWDVYRHPKVQTFKIRK